MKEVFLESVDGYNLCVHRFDVENPRAVIQFVHGMEEYQERYEKFIKFLNKNGYSCVSSDMRGHGKDAKNLGYFADKGGYKLLIEDQRVITRYIKENYENVPLYIFAHSMGTIITRVLLQTDSKFYDRVIFSGYPNYKVGARTGIFLAWVIKLFKGAKYKSRYMKKLGIDVFNKDIKNPRSNVDWICKNEKVVNEYLKDNLCGIGFTVSAFSDLFHLVVMMHQWKRYKDVNKNISFLMLCGKEDPCVGGDRGSNDSILVLKRAGFTDISSKKYENMRHEILNEVENEKVYADVLHFLEKNA